MCNQTYLNLVCPECENEGEFEKDDNEEVYCKNCGVVIKSPYPYTAGIRFKTLTEMLEDNKNEEKKKDFWRMRKCTVLKNTVGWLV